MKYLNLLHIAIGLLSLSGSTLVQGNAIPAHGKSSDELSTDVYATYDVEAVYDIDQGPSEVHIGSRGYVLIHISRVHTARGDCMK